MRALPPAIAAAQAGGSVDGRALEAIYGHRGVAARWAPTATTDAALRTRTAPSAQSSDHASTNRSARRDRMKLHPRQCGIDSVPRIEEIPRRLGLPSFGYLPWPSRAVVTVRRPAPLQASFKSSTNPRLDRCSADRSGRRLRSDQ